MTHQRGLSIREDGSPSAPCLNSARVSDRKDLPVRGMKSPAVDPFLDGPFRYSKLDQLASAHDAMLSISQSGDLPPQPDVSEFSHDISWLSSDTPLVLPLWGDGSARGGRC